MRLTRVTEDYRPDWATIIGALLPPKRRMAGAGVPRRLLTVRRSCQRGWGGRWGGTHAGERRLMCAHTIYRRSPDTLLAHIESFEILARGRPAPRWKAEKVWVTASYLTLACAKPIRSEAAPYEDFGFIFWVLTGIVHSTLGSYYRTVLAGAAEYLEGMYHKSPISHLK